MKNTFGDDVAEPAQAATATNAFGDAIIPHAEIAKDPGLMEALFPRASAAQGQGKGYLPQVGAAAQDISSGLLRVPQAAGDMIPLPWAKAGGFKQNLGRINQGLSPHTGEESYMSGLSRDPATVPSMLVGGAVPGGATALGKLGMGVLGGIAQGTTSAAIHQAGAEKPSLADAAKEVGWSAALGGLIGGTAGVLQKGGQQVVKSFLKAGHTGRAEGLDVANVFKHNLQGTAEGMAQKTEAALEELKGQQKEIITANAEKKIPVGKIFSDVYEAAQADMKSGKHFGDEKVVEEQLQAYATGLRNIVDPMTGEVNLPLANQLKSKLQTDAAALYKAARSGKDTKAMASQKVAAELATKLKDAIEAAVPEITKVNPKFKEIIPIAKAIGRRNVIAGQHNPIGLDELAAVEAGTNFMLHGEAAGGILPFLVRASKSPGAGSAAYRLGDLLGGGAKPRTLASLIAGSTQGPQR